MPGRGMHAAVLTQHSCYWLLLLDTICCHYLTHHHCLATAVAEFLEGVERKGELLRSGLREALAGNPHLKVGGQL